MITLYTAANELRAMLDQIDENGELPEGFEDVRTIVARKAVSVAAYVRHVERDVESAKEWLKGAQKQIAAEESRADRLRDYLLFHMQSTGITEIKDESSPMKIKRHVERDASVEIFEPGLVPADYMREPPPPPPAAPDKLLIKKAIGDGSEVPGARLLKKDRLEIK